MSRILRMVNVCWFLVDLLSRRLKTDERDAVRGDLEESSAPASKALQAVLGLVIRREFGLWKGWRPWLSLGGVVIPIGLLLSLVSRTWADGSAIYVFLYVDNWTWYFLKSPGARRDLLQNAGHIALTYSTLVAWSWTAGFALGSLSRRTLWITGTLFCLLVFGGTLGTSTVAQANSYNAAVFSQMFYSAVFPACVRVILVLLPAILAMRVSVRGDCLPISLTTFVVVVAGVLTTVACNAWRIRSRSMGTLTALVMIWPAVYIVADASVRRWRRDVVCHESNGST